MDIKIRFTEEFLLVLSDSEKSYILETDASDYTMGNTLKQKINKKFHPVTFYSRKFTNAEFNYEIHNKKVLIIIAIFKKWRIYYKKPKYSVTIYNDQKTKLIIN